MSSSRTPITDNPPPLSLEDYCGKMVVAILPGARKRKGETNQGRIDRKAYQSKMEDKMADLNDSIKPTPRRTVSQIREATKSKLTNYAVDGGHGTSIQYQQALDKLGNLSDPARPGDMPGPLISTLDVLERLAFSGGSSNPTSTPASSRVTSTSSNNTSASTRSNQVPSIAGNGKRKEMEPPSSVPTTSTTSSKNRQISSGTSGRDSVIDRAGGGLSSRPSSSSTVTSTSRGATLTSKNTGLDQSKPLGTATGSNARPQSSTSKTNQTSNNDQTSKPSSQSKPQSSSSSNQQQSRSKAVPEISAPKIQFTAKDIQNDKKLPRSELLNQWRKKMGKPQVEETLLLKDMMFLFQGINGGFVGFEEVKELPKQGNGLDQDGNNVDDVEDEILLKVKFLEKTNGVGEGINSPVKDLCHRLIELGRLFKRIKNFQESTSGKGQEVGLVMQSLKHFISKELSDYYKLIAILEDELNKGIMKENENPTTNSTSLTLKRVILFTEKSLLRFRLISTLIQSCSNQKGGSLISLIHSYTFNGDPFIRSFTSSLLSQVSIPFFKTLSKWIYEGELDDPFDEFFVKDDKSSSSKNEVEDDDGDEETNDKIWKEKFSFRKEMLPSFLRESFARKIFSTGKSLNFIRYSCDDSDWVATRNHLNGSEKELRYADIEGLEQTIEMAFTIASKRLLDIFLDKFKLVDHLRALKDYLMLGRGDFVEVLMESIGPSLNRPSHTLFRHNLSASLETAVRGSNTQYEDADILRRLDAKILESHPGDTGWDTFSLDYHIDSPVSTVLDNQCMENYKIVFNHLWKLKRIEVNLGISWRRCEKSCGVLRRVRGDELTTSLQKVSRKAMIQLSEMIHFTRQIQGYCQLEVLDYSWHDLKDFFKKREGDLDELIETHRIYLDSLIGKMLLRGSGKRGHLDALAEEVRSNLDTMLSFSKLCDDLSHIINADIIRYDLVSRNPPSASRKSAASSSSSRPNTPMTKPDSISNEDPKEIQKLSTRMDEISGTFKERTDNLITSLSRHPNLVVRDLGVRLDFNAFYKPPKEGSDQ